jgi:DNA-binding transcriptional ArsR family regulator
MGKAKAGKYSTNGNLQPKMRQTAILLKHVSDPTRLQVISMLSEAEMYVGAMCRELNLNQPAMSHHLALLRNSGVIEPRRQELLAGVIKKVTR